MISSNKPSTLNKKLLIDRIWKDTKYQARQTKESFTSTAITQSSPNQQKSHDQFLQNFFDNFQSKCIINHHNVPVPNRMPLYRNLKPQFLQTRSRYYNKQKNIQNLNFVAKQNIENYQNLPIINNKSISNKIDNKERIERVQTENYYSQNYKSYSLNNQKKNYENNTYGIHRQRIYRNQSTESLNLRSIQLKKKNHQPVRLKSANSFKILPNKSIQLYHQNQQNIKMIKKQLKEIYQLKQPIHLNQRQSNSKQIRFYKY